jgi:hypothetical protein
MTWLWVQTKQTSGTAGRDVPLAMLSTNRQPILSRSAGFGALIRAVCRWQGREVNLTPQLRRMIAARRRAEG